MNLFQLRDQRKMDSYSFLPQEYVIDIYVFPIPDNNVFPYAHMQIDIHFQEEKTKINVYTLFLTESNQIL